MIFARVEQNGEQGDRVSFWRVAMASMSGVDFRVSISHLICPINFHVNLLNPAIPVANAIFVYALRFNELQNNAVSFGTI